MYFKLFRLAVNALYFLTHSSDAHFNEAEPSLAFLTVPPVYSQVTLSIKLIIITLLIWLFLTTQNITVFSLSPLSEVATGKVEQALRPVLNLIFCRFNFSERLLKSHHVFLVLVIAGCSQLLLKSLSKLFENVE